MIDIEKLEALEQSATPGPWDTGMLSMEICTSNSYTDWCRVGANERLAVAARNALPDLLAEVKRLRKENAELDESLCEALGNIDYWAMRCHGLENSLNLPQEPNEGQR